MAPTSTVGFTLLTMSMSFLYGHSGSPIMAYSFCSLFRYIPLPGQRTVGDEAKIRRFLDLAW